MLRRRGLCFDNNAEEAVKHHRLSWQVVTSALIEMLQDENERKSVTVKPALMQMSTLDIATLKQAFDR